MLSLWSLSHFRRSAWTAALSVQADQQWTCFPPGLPWILCSSPQTPRCHFLIASGARWGGVVASAGGMHGKPMQKGGSGTWGCRVVGEKSLCSWGTRGSTARKARVVVQLADPVGLVSARVSRRKQQNKNLQIFLEGLQPSLFKDNSACFLFTGSCLLNYRLGFLKAGKECRDQ